MEQSKASNGADDLRFQRANMTPSDVLSNCNSGSNSGSSDSSSGDTWLWVKSGFTSSYGAALIIAIAVFGVLVTVQPPFVKTQSTSVEDGHLSWTSIAVWTLIVFLLVLMIPPACRMCGTAFKTPS